MSRVLLLAATRKGGFVLESDSERTDWDVRGPFLKGWDVSDLVLDTRTEPMLYAAVGHFVYGPTIQYSADMGETWMQAETNPGYSEDSEADMTRIWTLVPGRPSEPDVLYAGVDEAGLFVTRDGGSTWTELDGLRRHETSDHWFPGNGGLCCHTVLLDPQNDGRMWVGISAAGVFRTDDGGESWSLKNDGLEVAAPAEQYETLGSCVHRLVLDPETPSRLYQQNHLGVYRSTSAGDQWESVTDGLPSTFGFPIAMHPHDPETLYTFPLESDEYRLPPEGQPAVYRTTSAGDAWERCADGLPADAWVTVLRQAMAMDRSEPAGVYVGTTGGQIFYSADEGDSWSTIDCQLPKIHSLTTAVLE